MEGDARRISYQALRKGVPVRASGGEEIGTVEHVLQVPELDVFDGVVLKTADGLRFADANQVADINIAKTDSSVDRRFDEAKIKVYLISFGRCLRLLGVRQSNVVVLLRDHLSRTQVLLSLERHLI